MPSWLATGGSQRTGPLPLHPMSVGDILDGAFKLFRANARTLVICVAAFTAAIKLADATDPGLSFLNVQGPAHPSLGKPQTLLGCVWGAWYELDLVRRVPRRCFAPPPSVDAAVLRATRRAEPLVPETEARRYEALLRRAFDAQAPLDRLLPRRVVHRVAHEHGFDPQARARDLDARQWARLYAAVRSATPRPRAAAARRRRGSRRSR